METKVLQVFYGKDALPYKDQERSVHFPILGTDFVGSNNVSKIKFYFERLGDSNTTWVAVSKLPNGKIGSKVLETYNDEDLGEHYALLDLGSYYTQYKGDVFISLQGYQGGVNVTYDSEEQLYEISGTPTIRATGSIKFSINYATQFIGSGEEENVDLQAIMGALGEKADIDTTIQVVDSIATVELGNYEDLQIFYSKEDQEYFYKYNDAYYKYDNGILGSRNALTRYWDFEDTTRLSTICSLVGSNKAFLLRYSNKDYLTIIEQLPIPLTPDYFYSIRAIDIKTLLTRYVDMNDGTMTLSQLFSSNIDNILHQSNYADYAVPYSGATKNVDLGSYYLKTSCVKIGDAYHTIELVGDDLVIGSGVGDIFIQPSEKLYYGSEEVATQEYVNEYISISSFPYSLSASEYSYALLNRARIKDGNDVYVKSEETNSKIIFRNTRLLDFLGTYFVSGNYIEIDKSTKVATFHTYSADFYTITQSNNRYYTKGQVDQKIQEIIENSFQNVDTSEYPTLQDFLDSEGEEGYIYLYPIDVSDLTKGYYQYIWEYIESDDDYEWEYLGTTQIDLSDYYTKAQTDTLLSSKANISDAVMDTDIVVSGGYVTQVAKSGIPYPIAQSVTLYTTPKVVENTTDLPSTNDGYLYLVMDDGYLYYWDESQSAYVQGYEYVQDISNFVLKTTTIAGIALSANISAQSLTDALVFMNNTTDLDYVMED